MHRRQNVETALAAWRDAERRLATASDGEVGSLRAEVAAHKGEFLRLSGDQMLDQIDRLRGAERRRVDTVPSTDAYHAAARDETSIAAEIWNDAQFNDEALPRA